LRHCVQLLFFASPPPSPSVCLSCASVIPLCRPPSPHAGSDLG
jgi:hypothetical protein